MEGVVMHEIPDGGLPGQQVFEMVNHFPYTIPDIDSSRGLSRT
jgi:hypothetical protein